MALHDDFTVERAIEIQQRQLKEWEQVLKPEIFSELSRLINEKTEREKHTYKSGDQVLRGSDIDNSLYNWFILKNDFNQ